MVQRTNNKPRDPAVSVLMATYNNAPYLREAIDDILGQTFKDFELVLIDDGSTDKTQETLRSYRDSRLVLLRNEQRRGVAAARNRTIAASRAPLIAVADADDRYDLRRLEKQVAFLRKYPEVDIAVSDFYKMTADGKVFERVRIPRTDSRLKLNFLWQNPLSHPTALCRREVVLNSVGYDESLSSAVDTDWFARMSEYAIFGVLSDPLHYNRKHPASVTANRGPDQSAKRFGISHRLLCKYLEREVPEQDGHMLKTLLCAYIKMPPEGAGLAFGLLDELAGKVASKESPVNTRWFKRRVAESMLKQSVYLTYEAPGLSRELLKRAASFSFLEFMSAQMVFQIIRLAFAKLRRVKRPL